MTCRLLALLGCLLASPVQGQNEVPPPKSPVIGRAPDAAEWTITLSRDRDRARKQFERPDKADTDELAPDPKVRRLPKPESITVTKNKDLYRERIKWSDGPVSEKWILSGGFQLLENRSSGGVSRVPTEYTVDSSDYTRTDFEDLEWVGLDNYVGPNSLNGHMVYEFSVDFGKKRMSPREVEYQANGSQLAGGDPKSHRIVAYLDVKTQLPVFYDDGITARIYKFSSMPPPQLVLPEKFQKELALYQKIIRARTAASQQP